MENKVIVETPELKKSQSLIPVVEKNVKNVVITNDTQALKADAVLTQIKTVENDFEKQRLFFTKPLNDQLTNINKLFKGFTLPLVEMKKVVSDKILAYRVEQEAAQREQQRKAEIEAAKLQKKLDKQAEKNGVEAPKVNMPVIAPVASRLGNSTVRKTWSYRVKSISLVPPEYFMIDDAKIKQAIRDGHREIKGLEIFQESSLSTRTK